MVAEPHCPAVPLPGSGTPGQPTFVTRPGGTVAGTESGTPSLKAFLARRVLERDRRLDSGRDSGATEPKTTVPLAALVSRPSGTLAEALLAAAERGAAAVAAGPADETERAEAVRPLAEAPAPSYRSDVGRASSGCYKPSRCARQAGPMRRRSSRPVVRGRGAHRLTLLKVPSGAAILAGRCGTRDPDVNAVTHAMPSSEAVTMRAPSGEKAALLTPLSWPRSAAQRWSWGGLLSPSTAFCLGVISASVVGPVLGLWSVALLAETRQPWRYSVLLILGIPACFCRRRSDLGIIPLHIRRRGDCTIEDDSLRSVAEGSLRGVLSPARAPDGQQRRIVGHTRAHAREGIVNRMVNPPRNRSAKPGAPYAAGVAIAVCNRIAAGEMLTQISKSPGMPDRRTVWTWTRDNPEFRQMHAQAREMQALGWVEELIELADTVEAEPGAVTKARLQIDTRKWVVAKHLPRLYGDRPDPFTPAIEDQSASGDWWAVLGADDLRELRDANEVILRLRAKAIRMKASGGEAMNGEGRSA